MTPRTEAERRFDLVCLGRAAVDLYSEQLGAPLEDAQTFAKSLGGCAANVAVGSARLGLRVAMISRVGDEHMGRFVRGALASEGVDVSHVATDPDRLTALVLLGLRDRDTFPLIFYRTDCADMAIAPEEVDRAWIGSSRALLLTGTHLSTPAMADVSRLGLDCARAMGTRVVLDIDYRPVLWGLTAKGRGEDRFVAAERVTAALRPFVADCDLLVGTEEELHVAGGTVDTLAALRALRCLTRATIVVKRGARGAVAFDGAIPATLEDGVTVPAFPTVPLNVLGAGDAFLGAFLSGWLHGAPLARCLELGNAAGAIVVTRHGCAPAMPTRVELDDFLDRAHSHEQSVALPATRFEGDARLDHLHRVSTRERAWPELCVFAFDHRAQLEHMVDAAGVPRTRIRALKNLLARALATAAKAPGAAGRTGCVVDDGWGEDALFTLTDAGLFVARPIEVPASHLTEAGLAFEGGRDVGLTLRRWPREHVVKCLVDYHPDEGARRRRQEELLSTLQEAAFATGHELLLEPIPRDTSGKLDNAALPRALSRLYEIGLRPDWWKLPPQSAPTAWRALERLVLAADPSCRGILVLGLDAPEAELARSFRAAAGVALVRGFAVGRTIFSRAAHEWIAGRIDDATLIAEVTAAFGRVAGAWRARAATTEDPCRV